MSASVLPSVEASARSTVRDLFAFITAQGIGDYIGEKVSQLQHSLQAATLAQKAGADDDTVLGALLHDVGRFIPAADKMPIMTAADGTFVGTASHEILGETYLRQLGFSDAICQLVGAHVMAKRYLTAVDTSYYDGLSPSSKTTLRYQVSRCTLPPVVDIANSRQGGIFDKAQVKAAQQDPLLEAKLSVRRWDDLAKDPEMKTPDLASFEEMAVQSLMRSQSHFELHGRNYRLPAGPTVAICVDGLGPEYLSQGMADGILPNLAAMVEHGFSTTAKSAMPSFTNPNNVPIITGGTVAQQNNTLHGKTGEEQMITDDSLLRGSTLLEIMEKRGVRVAAVTAEDKLRAIASHVLELAICFSAEKAANVTVGSGCDEKVEKWLGQKAPPQYSGELSLFVLDAGIKLLEEDRADFLYLALSDYIENKYAPGSEESNAFLSALDAKIGKLVSLGAEVAVTGDHGMNERTSADRTPNILYLEDALNEKWGPGQARVICSITDPVGEHLGALNSFARVSLTRGDVINDVLQHIRTLPQVEIALKSAEAAKRYGLGPTREGDIVVIANTNAVIGSHREEHDLSNLGEHRLRTQGGLSEQNMPLLMSRPAPGASGGRQWRNFDIFELLLSH